MSPLSRLSLGYLILLWFFIRNAETASHESFSERVSSDRNPTLSHSNTNVGLVNTSAPGSENSLPLNTILKDFAHGPTSTFKNTLDVPTPTQIRTSWSNDTSIHDGPTTIPAHTISSSVSSNSSVDTKISSEVPFGLSKLFTGTSMLIF